MGFIEDALAAHETAVQAAAVDEARRAKEAQEHAEYSRRIERENVAKITADSISIVSAWLVGIGVDPKTIRFSIRDITLKNYS